jgi:hypothetical protein
MVDVHAVAQGLVSEALEATVRAELQARAAADTHRQRLLDELRRQ